VTENSGNRDSESGFTKVGFDEFLVELSDFVLAVDGDTDVDGV